MYIVTAKCTGKQIFDGIAACVMKQHTMLPAHDVLVESQAFLFHQHIDFFAWPTATSVAAAGLRNELIKIRLKKRTNVKNNSFFS